MHHSAARLDAPIKERPCVRLLIVDDDQLIRELYSRVLSSDGYEVETAEDGVAALERLADEHFDLVLTDMEMPRLDGGSMVLAMRAAGSRIPVIMISAALTHRLLSPAVIREFSTTLRKPVRRADLILAVAKALRPKPRHESLRRLCGPNLIAA